MCFHVATSWDFLLYYITPFKNCFVNKDTHIQDELTLFGNMSPLNFPWNVISSLPITIYFILSHFLAPHFLSVFLFAGALMRIRAEVQCRAFDQGASFGRRTDLGCKFLFAQRNDLWARRKESEETQGKTGNSCKKRKESLTLRCTLTLQVLEKEFAA